jgi:hypothetical protein
MSASDFDTFFQNVSDDSMAAFENIVPLIEDHPISNNANETHVIVDDMRRSKTNGMVLGEFPTHSRSTGVVFILGGAVLVGGEFSIHGRMNSDMYDIIMLCHGINQLSCGLLTTLTRL